MIKTKKKKKEIYSLNENNLMESCHKEIKSLKRSYIWPRDNHEVKIKNSKLRNK